MADDSLEASYAKDFRGQLPFGKRPALIIIDAVRAYVEPGAPLHAPVEPNALRNMVRLREAAWAAGAPVILTLVSFRPDGADGGLFWKKLPALKVFTLGNPLGDLPPALKPALSDIVLYKHYASAFFGTSLASMLAAHRVDTLVITGFSTSGCVRATALDAIQSGFAPFVVRDAVSDRHPAPHEANLFDLQAKYAEVVTTDAMLGALAQG